MVILQPAMLLYCRVLQYNQPVRCEISVPPFGAGELLKHAQENPWRSNASEMNDFMAGQPTPRPQRTRTHPPEKMGACIKGLLIRRPVTG